MKKIVLAAVLSTLVAAPAIAAPMYSSARSNYGYIGINAGQNKYSATSTSTFSASTAYSLFGGYAFNQYIAAEAAYTNLGSAKLDPDDGTTSFTGSLMSLSAIGSMPIGQTFALFAKLGYGQSKVESNSSAAETKSGVVYGVGAQFNVGKAVGIRLGYDRFKVGSTTEVDSSLMTVGALVKF